MTHCQKQIHEHKYFSVAEACEMQCANSCTKVVVVGHTDPMFVCAKDCPDRVYSWIRGYRGTPSPNVAVPPSPKQ